MTKAVIADDERLMREQLRARLHEVWPQLHAPVQADVGAPLGMHRRAAERRSV